MRALLAILAIPCISSAALAQVDPKVHSKCSKAADYKGCVEVMTRGSQPASLEPNSITRLKDALRLLPSRLENTNLRDFTSNTQVFTDAVATAADSDARNDYEKELLSEARSIRNMVDALESYWYARIHDGTYYGSYGYKSYKCYVLRPKLDSFNLYASPNYYVSYNGVEKNTFLIGKTEECSPQEFQMISAINRRVNDALVDPEKRKAEIAKQKREKELAKLGPWLRYLEENPKIKEWAQKNPVAAEREKEKFLKRFAE